MLGIQHQLPSGVMRDMQCEDNVDLTNCRALKFEYIREDGSNGSLVVWRDGVSGLKPIERSKRLRELRPDDHALEFDKPVTLLAVIVYR